MRLWGYFMGEWLNGPVFWPDPGLPMMNGRVGGLVRWGSVLPGTAQRDLGTKLEEDFPALV